MLAVLGGAHLGQCGQCYEVHTEVSVGSVMRCTLRSVWAVLGGAH